MIEVDADLLARHDRPGPRYTSYPTAVEFSDDFGPDDYRQRLASAARTPAEPLSLYVHLPFCQARCSFCACHVVVARRPEVAEPYLGRVVAEAELVAARLGERRRVVQYHWGGGTPTHHPPQLLADLHHRLTDIFELDPDAEVAIEVDPRVTTEAHLETLQDLGFNRISLGVQDLDDEVQQLIGRHQTVSQTIGLYEEARRLGFDSINLDLIYGLPGQTPETLRRTLGTVTRLRPDRLAVYSFAWVPWMRPHQRRMDEERLPDTRARFELLALVVSALTEGGYIHIGMDHFALPDDDLVLAARTGTLTRTFMGYTTWRNTDTVALGTSGISAVAGGYAQNHRRLASYYEAVDRGELPIERGYRLSAGDLIRREIIIELMCNSRVDLAAVGSAHGIDAGRMFVHEMEAIGRLATEGLAEVDGAEVRATELGRLFVRRLAMCFDAYSVTRIGSKPVFSKSV